LNNIEKGLSSNIQQQQVMAHEYERTQDTALIPVLQERQQDVTKTRQWLQDKRRKAVRKEFSQKQAVINIRRQLMETQHTLSRESTLNSNIYRS
jgi:hypothetical protein